MRLPTTLGSLALSLLLSTADANAQVTVYGQIPLAQTLSAPGAATTTLAAYNDTELIPPPLPTALARQFKVDLQKDAVNVPNLSMQHLTASFFGFSIEMSVINQVLGKNSTFIQVPFLNLMANLQERAGHVLIRLGGNTQEYAVMVDHLDNGRSIAKEKASLTQTTLTPAVLYTIDMFYMAANISQFVNVNWFLGIPFNDTNWRFAIIEYGEAILGDKLVGLQAGNEPDLYERHGHRPAPYGPMDYFQDFGTLLQALGQNDKVTRKNILIGPSLATGDWVPEMVWDTGFIPTYSDSLYALSVEHYPNNNCHAQFGTGTYQDPQENFPDYLTHNAGVNLVKPYLNSTAIAQQAGKPFIMFETNTASCGGFPGISDSFGAALWAMDYGFQMAYSNFSNALIHIGGQNVYYNPFTAPPTNQSTFNQWTVGAIYYSVLVLAEAFGKSNTSQIVDLTGAIGSEFTPAYAIYENAQLSKVALFNYNDDMGGSRGAGDLSVTLSLATGVPDSVKVKYLDAKSVSSKYNITWANQTFGNKFEVDGRLKGALNVVDIPCNTGTNECVIPVKAPGFALVFLNSNDEFVSLGQSPSTFTTSAHTKTINTATVDPLVLATSNGHSEKDRAGYGSTSKGGLKISAGVHVRGEVLGAVVAGGIVAGVLAVIGLR